MMTMAPNGAMAHGGEALTPTIALAPASAPASVVEEPAMDEIIIDRSKESQGFIKRYRRGKLLGKGGFAKCFEMTSLDSGRTYAGKVVPKSTLQKSSAKKKLLNEIKIHKSLDHANIVRFERFFEDKNNVYILLETMMELIKQRKRLSEPEVRYYMLQLVHTMRHLHQRQVIHRDLKLGNLFLSESLDIKLGDFGLAARLEFEGERKKTVCGTPNYIAPEILDGKNGHSFEVDVWSLGVICYTLLIGKPPFETSNVKSTYKRIKANEYSFPSYIQISNEAVDLVRSILHLEPEHRPSLDAIEAHPFLRGETPRVMPLTALSIQPLFKKSELYYPTPALMPMQTCTPASNILSTVHESSGCGEKENTAFIQPQMTSGAACTIGAQEAERAKHHGDVAFMVGGAPFSALSLNKDNMAALQPPASMNILPAPPVGQDSMLNVPPQTSILVSRTTAGSATATLCQPGFASSLNVLQPSTSNANSQFARLHAPAATSACQAPLPTASTASAAVSNLTVAPFVLAQTSTLTQHLNSAPAHALPSVSFPAHPLLNITSNGSGQLPCTAPLSSSSAFAAGVSAPNPIHHIHHHHSQPPISARPASSALISAGPCSAFSVPLPVHTSTMVASTMPTTSSANETDADVMPMDCATATAANSCDAMLPALDEEESGSLRGLHHDLERSIARHQISSLDSAAAGACMAPVMSNQHLDVWVSKWVDYSEKYGLGYLLSNSACGVYFNDSSRIILSPDSVHFEYQDRRLAPGQVPSVQRHTLQDFPAELHKKATLLKHFRKYLLQHSAKPAPVTASSSASQAVYVKRWLRTKHAILFRLSNRTVQVNFMDHTEVILASIQNLVTFTDKTGVRTSYALNAVLDQCPSPELYRRIKYTKEILAHMLSRK